MNTFLKKTFPYLFTLSIVGFQFYALLKLSTYCLIASSFVFVFSILLIFFIWKNSLLVIFLKIFKGDITNLNGILIMFILIFNIGIAGNFFYSSLGNPATFIDNFVKGIFCVSISLFPFILYSYKKKKDSDSDNVKVLITGLSLLPRIETLKQPFEVLKKEVSEMNIDSQGFKHNPIRKSLEKHKNIERVILIQSPEVVKFHALIQNDDDIKEYHILNLIGKWSSNVAVEFITVDDINDFSMIKEKIDCLFHSKQMKGYKDENFVFNITSSTAVLSSVLTLNAIKGERNAEYVHQTTKELIKIDINIFSVNELIQELIKEINDTKMRTQ